MSETPDPGALSPLTTLPSEDYGTLQPRRPAPRPPRRHPRQQPPPPYTSHTPSPDQDHINLHILFRNLCVSHLDLQVDATITIRDLQYRIQAVRPISSSPDQFQLFHRGYPIYDSSLTLRQALHFDRGQSQSAVNYRVVMHVHVVNMRSDSAGDRRTEPTQHHHISFGSACTFWLGVLFGWSSVWLARKVFRSSG